MFAAPLAWIGSQLSGIAIKLALVLGIVLAVGAVLLGAKNAGRTAEKAEGLKRQLDNAKERTRVEDEIARRPDGAAADELRNKWSRD